MTVAGFCINRVPDEVFASHGLNFASGYLNLMDEWLIQLNTDNITGRSAFLEGNSTKIRLSS
jgi:hypothetical protein